MEGTQLGDLDLSQTTGLKSIVHLGPSSLGTDTLHRSQGNIPEVFLRGCGLSDWEIQAAKLYSPALGAGEIVAVLYEVGRLKGERSIEFYSCFISYSTKDQEFADRLHADLQDRGVRCWFAPHDISAGRKVYEQIDEAIHLYDRLLLILSEHSMSSEWVKTEIAHARQKELNEKRQVLFPISLVSFEKIRDWKNFDADTGKDSAREIREYFIPDFSNWKDHDSYQAAFERLVTDLKTEEKKPAR
jgi:hypothetical protein